MATSKSAKALVHHVQVEIDDDASQLCLFALAKRTPKLDGLATVIEYRTFGHGTAVAARDLPGQFRHLSRFQVQARRRFCLRYAWLPPLEQRFQGRSAPYSKKQIRIIRRKHIGTEANIGSH